MSGGKTTFGDSEACAELWRIAVRDGMLRVVSRKVHKVQAGFKGIATLKDPVLRQHVANLYWQNAKRWIPDSFSEETKNFYLNVLKWSYWRYHDTNEH